MNELVVIERQLQAVEPQLHNALAGLMPAKRLIQTVLISCERTPKLLACRPQSILNGAMTFAVLGLPVDGATGQGFLIPFADKAQAVIGFKGYNTLGARAGLTITGAAVREDDHIFDYLLGDNAFVHHKPRLDSTAKLVAFWAVAAAKDRPPIVSILSMADVMAIKQRSPAVRGKADTPWNDPGIGFIAMGEKSAKRRLARSTPLITEAPQFMLAARMEEAFDEQGKSAFVLPERGVVVDGEYTAAPTFESAATPSVAQLIGPKPVSPQTSASVAANEPVPPALTPPTPAPGGAGDTVPDWGSYVDRWAVIVTEATSGRQLAAGWNSQRALRNRILWPDDDGKTFAELKTRVEAKIAALKAEQEVA